MSAGMAMDIIDEQVKEGKLDRAYFDIFVAAKVYNLGREAELTEVGVGI
jgi:hypothetical protein